MSNGIILESRARMDRLAYGYSIERDAEVWLLRRLPGARVLVRNLRYRVGEIDLVLEAGSTLHFIEIRARRNAMQSGLESVSGKKSRRLALAIRRYLSAYRGGARDLQVDVLSWDGLRFSYFPNIRLHETN